MIAICQKCGIQKAAPNQRCSSCSMVPKNDDELAIAFMLTDQFLPKEKLTEASRLIKSGQQIELPPHIRTAVLAALQSARTQEATRTKSIGNVLNGWAIFAGVIFLIYLIFAPWPHYQLALFINKAPSYEGFLNRFPSSNLVDEAKEQIHLLKEDDVWDNVNLSKDIKALRRYKMLYPNGKHLYYANEQIRECADNRWESISNTDSKTEVLEFLKEYPETTKTADAEARVITIADKKWELISNTESKSEVVKFLKDYPETTKSSEAESHIVAIADSQWLKIATTRSVGAINEFLNDFPETSMRLAAEKRIQELYNDFDWVREQDLLKYYVSFLDRNPNHPQRAWLEKRIIDLEVKEIAAGDYGELPPAQPLRIGGGVAILELENKTGYELSVRYSGPDSKKLVIPKGATQSVSLMPGEYQVAASVSATNVQNFYGKDTMRAGSYSSGFYIQTDYSRGKSTLPSYIPKKIR